MICAYCLLIAGHCGERSQKTKRDVTLLKPAYKTDLFDDPCYINTQALQSAACTARATAAAQGHGSPLHHASRCLLLYGVFLCFEKRGLLSHGQRESFWFPHKKYRVCVCFQIQERFPNSRQR